MTMNTEQPWRNGVVAGLNARLAYPIFCTREIVSVARQVL